MNKYEFGVYNLLEKSLEFDILNNKMKKFNPLKILEFEEAGIKHSNILAWLLDPNSNHKLGSFFVKKLLEKVISKQENQDTLQKYDIDTLYIKHNPFEDLEVMQDVNTYNGEKIDILAVSNIKNHVILIENRFKSIETVRSLSDNLTYVNKNYSGYTTVPIFISLYEVESIDNNYLFLDYSDVLNILIDFISEYEDYINKSIVDFIKYYIDILQSELIKDEEDIKLAAEIYKSHKNAVDLLVISNKVARSSVEKYVNKDLYDYYISVNERNTEIHNKFYLRYKQSLDLISAVGNDTMRMAFLKFVSVNDIPEVCYCGHVRVPSFILPKFKELDMILGKPRWSYWLNNVLIIWFERVKDNRLKINLEVGPVEYNKRLILLNKLESKRVDIKSMSKMPDVACSKIYTSYVLVGNWAKENEILNAMNKLYNDSKFKEIINSIIEVIDEMEVIK